MQFYLLFEFAASCSSMEKIYRQTNFKTYVSQIGSTGINSLLTLKGLCKKETSH